jgi:hypothetical protein
VPTVIMVNHQLRRRVVWHRLALITTLSFLLGTLFAKTTLTTNHRERTKVVVVAVAMTAMTVGETTTTMTTTTTTTESGGVTVGSSRAVVGEVDDGNPRRRDVVGDSFYDLSSFDDDEVSFLAPPASEAFFRAHRP